MLGWPTKNGLVVGWPIFNLGQKIQVWAKLKWTSSCWVSKFQPVLPGLPLLCIWLGSISLTLYWSNITYWSFSFHMTIKTFSYLWIWLEKKFFYKLFLWIPQKKKKKRKKKDKRQKIILLIIVLFLTSKFWASSG